MRLCPACFTEVDEIDLQKQLAPLCPECGEPLEPDPGTTRTHDVGKSPSQTVPGHAPSEEPLGPSVEREAIGRYRVIKMLGTGGFGTVFLAHDPELDRLVAIKMPHARHTQNLNARERFRREARSAAHLHHPGIVEIYSVEQDGDLPFIVYEYVAGTTLTQYVESTAPTFRKIAELVRDVARALEFSHSRGVVHRDVKPANILVDTNGIPRLADFGLARRADDIKVTVDGQILGTPAYMSPEQASGDQNKIGEASDIYSLGVVLFVLLTGDLPFRGKVQMVVQQVINDFPRNPRSLNDAVPLDLETICQKAMEKEPQRRYGSACELADDIDRWLTNRPVRARHIGTAGRLLRWCLRNRTTAALVTTVATLVVAVACVSSYLFIREYSHVTENLDLLNAQYVAQGTAFFEPQPPLGCPNPLAGLPWLAAGLEADVRNPEREAVDRIRLGFTLRSSPRIVQMFFEDAPVTFASFDPPCKRVVTCGSGPFARIWDVATGQSAVPPLSHSKNVLQARFSPDGQLVATCSEDGTARLWNSRTGAPVTEPLQYTIHRAEGSQPLLIFRVCFSPNGLRLATVDSDRMVGVWEIKTGKLAYPPLVHATSVIETEFSPDSSRLLTAEANGAAHLWDAASGKSTATFDEHKKNHAHVQAAHFSINEHTAASGDNLGSVFVWNPTNGTISQSFPRHAAPISVLAFSPDGNTLASASVDGVVKLWSVKSGQQIGQPITHARSVVGIQFSPDGQLLATASMDGLAGLWQATTGKAAFSPLPHPKGLSSVAFSRDGRFALTVSSDGPVRIWAYRPDTITYSTLPPGPSIACAATGTDGHKFAAADNSGAIAMGSLEDPTKACMTDSQGSVQCLAFNRDCSVLASGSARVARLWQTNNGRPIGQRLSHGSKVFAIHRLLLSPDATRLVSLARDWHVYVWDTAAGKCLCSPVPHPGPVTDIELSPDGRRFATIGGPTICIWSIANGEPLLKPLEEEGKVAFVCFTPSGDSLLSAGDKGASRWHFSTRGVEHTPLVKDSAMRWVSFNPRGGTIATVTWDGTAQIWNESQHTAATRPMRHPEPVTWAAFSPNGWFLVTRTQGDVLRIWDIRSGLLITPPITVEQVRHISLNQNSDAVYCLCRDQLCRIGNLTADPRKLDRLIQVSQLTSAHSVNPIGGLVPLSFTDTHRLWTEMAAATLPLRDGP
jgi:WD40 repeat protein/predicted Ser/Thr protein kinase